MFKKAIAGPRRRGAVAVLVALCLVLLVSVTAVALDGGMLLSSRRVAQGAADAGALAAAGAILSRVTDKVDSNGKAHSAAEGAVAFYVRGRADVTLVPAGVSVRVAPQSPVEPSAAVTNASGQLLDGYVEVIVELKQKRYFSAVFGSTADLPVRARAVARGYPRFRDAVIVLDPDDSLALHVDGVDGDVTLAVGGEGAGIVVNSKDGGSHGAAEAGGGATVTAARMRVVGTETTQSNGTWNIDTAVVRNALPTADPLRHLPTPDPVLLGLPAVNQSDYSGTVTLQPGIYRNGIRLSGDSGTVTLQPGVYFISEGGFTVSGRVRVQGNGVLIYNGSPPSDDDDEHDGISVGDDNVVQLTPLDSNDTYQSQFNGLSVYVSRSSGTSVNLSGLAGTNILGTVYAAGSRARVEGFGDAVIGSRYITRTLRVFGVGKLSVQYGPDPSPLDRVLQLVE